MGFIRKKDAFSLLDKMESGSCEGSCRTLWMGHIRRALQSNTNPLQLTAMNRKKMTRRLQEVKNAKRLGTKTKTNKHRR